MFITTLTAAPINTVFVNILCRPVGIKYCMPVTLLIPIANIRQLSILSNVTTVPYPSPKNHGTKLFAIPINPKHNGIPRNQTKL